MSIRLRLIIAALLVAGIGGFVAAGVLGNGSDGDVSISGNAAIDAIIPARGAEVLHQQTVGVDLAAPYRLTRIVISPTANPSTGIDVTAEVEERAGLNLFEFSPGEGKLIEALSPDTNCVFITYVEIARPADPAELDWCFEVA